MKNILVLYFLMSFLQVFSQEKFILETTEKSRFKITDKVWKQTIGDVSVCLWNDDKLSAFTVTIDDNYEQDIPYWKQLQKKYQFPLTWFVITEADKKWNVKNWNLFAELAKNGNAVQGHDDRNWYEDLKNGVKYPTLKQYNKRLQKTITTIEKNTKQKCITYAYPWGEGNINEAAKHFIASRSTIGLLNTANQINFKKVHSISNPHIYLNDSTRNHYILPLLNKTSKLEGKNYYRGWGSVHFHQINTTKAQNTTDEFFNYLKQKEDKLWLATFVDVAKYAQEYATHTVKVTKNNTTEIAFTLKDEMQNEIYNYPLTVKVRIPNNWIKIDATQNGNLIPQKIITYNHNQYALVKAIPDRGKILLKGTVDVTKPKNNAITRYETATLKNSYHIPTTISKQAQEMLRSKKRSARNTAKMPHPNAPLSEWTTFQKNIDSIVYSGLQPIKDYYQPKIDTIFVGGIRAIEITPKNYKANNNVVVYIHGGSYVALSADMTIASILPLAATSGLRIIAIDYTLAPHKKFNQITNEVIQFYKALLQKYNAKNIAFYGDSAGGGLASGSILKMRDLGIELPSCLVLWSAWTDINEIGDTYFTLADNDPSLIYENYLANAALAYAPKNEFKNPYVSPVYGDFSKGFPPTLLQVGSKELFLSNAIRMYRALDNAGIATKLDVYEGMWHVWQGHYLLPESKKAVENTKKFILNHLKK